MNLNTKNKKILVISLELPHWNFDKMRCKLLKEYKHTQIHTYIYIYIHYIITKREICHCDVAFFHYFFPCLEGNLWQPQAIYLCYLSDENLRSDVELFRQVVVVSVHTSVRWNEWWSLIAFNSVSDQRVCNLNAWEPLYQIDFLEDL